MTSTPSAATGGRTPPRRGSPPSPTRCCRSSSSRRCSSAWTRRSTIASRRCSSAASRRSGSPITRTRSARSRSTCSTSSAIGRRCDLVSDVAQPVVSRVIHSFMGIPPEDDADWARLMNSVLAVNDPDLNPGGNAAIMERDVPEIFERCGKLIAERRENPTDDLTSVLVHAEIDGERLEEHEIVMGFFLLVAAGNDSTKATYCSGDARPARGPVAEADAARRSVAGPRRGRGVAADVPGVRPLPPHRDGGHRAERADDPRGREGGHVVRLLEPRRDALRGPGHAST